MNIQIHRVEYSDVTAMRELYRQEQNCQIICDSVLPRGFADIYHLVWDGRLVGYGAVRNRHDVGRVTEFYTLPHVRRHALPLFRELLAVGNATHIEAQTNIPLMLLMLFDCATNITTESLLFHDVAVTQLTCPHGVFRAIPPEEAETVFAHHFEPVGSWGIEAGGTIVATGGFLCHYNPPYGDVFMEVEESARQQGYGSYLVQEVKRVCYEAGKKPAARCDPDNYASRMTLQKAGFLPCARMLVGEVNLSQQS